MQVAVSYGMTFRCDPMRFLDRDEHDYPVLLALLHEADKRLKRRAEEAKRSG